MSQTLTPRPASASRLRQRVLIALVSLLLLVAAGWLSLVILTRIDELFLPNELNLGALTNVPGVQNAGDGPTERINILVMGLDRRPQEGDAPARTDTMFVLTIDPQTKTAGMLGIPRDLWVDYPYKRGGGCCYQERINAAYVLGETQGYPEGGIGLTMDVIEQNLGIHVDHYVMIDFEGFIELIDALGGITLYVEQTVDDPYYSYTEKRYDYLPIHFDAGETATMDGVTALGYARTRRNSSDFDRIRRQQQVIFAALDKATQQDWNDVAKIPGLWKKYKGAIKTDVNDLLVLRYAGLASGIETSEITAFSLGYATTGWTTPNGASVLLADKDLVQELVQALFSDHQLIEESAHVEVQNGSGEDGLADKVTRFLAGQGFLSTSLTALAAADGRLRPQTEIIDYSGKAYTMERLTKLLKVPDKWVRRAKPEDDSLRTETTTDIVVILGSDALTRSFSTGEEAANSR
ncbi:MAG: LCP family protein [Dehalococcoidia bacterium]